MSDEINQAERALFAALTANRADGPARLLAAPSDEPAEAAEVNQGERAALAGMSAEADQIAALLFPSEASLAQRANAQRSRDELHNSELNRRHWTEAIPED